MGGKVGFDHLKRDLQILLRTLLVSGIDKVRTVRVRERNCRLDLCAFMPLIEACDRHDVRLKAK